MSAIRNSDGKQVVFAVNTDTQVKSGDIDMSSFNIDYVTISPSGEFIIVNGNGDTTKVFDWSRRQVGPYWSNYGEPSHYDVTTYDGWDYVVGVSKSSPHDGRIISRNVFTGDIKKLTQGGYGSHSSARQVSRQGWVFSYNSSWAPYNDEIIASRLDGNRVERIVSVRGSYDIYENQAQPVVSPSGTRVIYASDWNSGSVPIQGYVVDFRDNAFPLDIKYQTIDGLVIYPIPSKDMLYVNGDYKVTLYDLSGKVVGNSLDISKLSNGVYIIELTDGDKRHIQKIIKK
jgi:hypothetical protein